MTRSDQQPFGAEIDAAIMRHAASDPAHEICGIVTVGGEQDRYAYHPLANIAANPARDFELSAADLAALPPPLAIVHSHPVGPPWPSFADMQAVQSGSIPWGIAVPPRKPSIGSHEGSHVGLFWFGGDIVAPLMERGYRHGVTDCYALVRDWFAHHHGLDLIDRPRAWNWWQQGGDLYDDHFALSGFVRLAVPDDIGPDENAHSSLKAGDVALAAVLSPVINHALIYLGDGLVLHHPAGRSGFDPARLPRCEPVERWRRYIRCWARHPDIKDT